MYYIRTACLACGFILLASTSSAQPVKYLLLYGDFSSTQEMNYATTPVQQDTLRETILGQAVGGFLVGGMGLFIGGFAGYKIDSASCDHDEWFCGAMGLALGVTVGEALGVTLGVHGATRNKGRFGPIFLGNLAVFVMGMLAASDLEGASPAFLLLIPTAQIGLSIYLERSTSR